MWQSDKNQLKLDLRNEQNPLYILSTRNFDQVFLHTCNIPADKSEVMWMYCETRRSLFCYLFIFINCGSNYKWGLVKDKIKDHSSLSDLFLSSRKINEADAIGRNQVFVQDWQEAMWGQIFILFHNFVENFHFNRVQ